jgi:hypothetical protein
MKKVPLENRGWRPAVQLRKYHRPQIRDGVRVANEKAVTAARYYLAKSAKGEPVSLREAARSHGSNVAYVQCAIWILKLDEPGLIDLVLSGRASIHRVARYAKPRVRLREAMSNASPAARADVARVFGPEFVWTEMVEPQL